MNMDPQEVALVFLLAVGAYGKTLRYRLVTNEEGNRELVPANNSTAAVPDIDFLEKELNISHTTPPSEAITETHADTTTHKISSSNDAIPDHHYQLMRKWNTFTADGWTRQKSDVYANSTKLVIYDDGKKSNDTYLEVKQGRSENLTAERQDDGLYSFAFWDVLAKLYECFQPTHEYNNTLDCIQTRITNTFMTFLGKSIDGDEGNSPEEKTFKHGKKLLKGALLPLLVLLIIKYLVALPVLLAGFVTIKTFWLSLLSAGVAAFGAPWKKHVLKRHEPEVFFTQPPPWLGMEKNTQNGEKYYM